MNNIISIPIIFTVMALLAGFNLSTGNGSTRDRNWSHSDGVFAMVVMISVLIPTWLLYLVPRWETAAIITATAFGFSFVTPRMGNSFNGKLARFFWCVSMAIAVLVAWLTWLGLFLEASGRPVLS